MELLSHGRKRNYHMNRVVALFLLTFLLFSIISGAITHGSIYQRVNALTGRGVNSTIATVPITVKGPVEIPSSPRPLPAPIC
jgi:hypothetical protein